MLYSVVIAVGSRPPTHLPRAPPRSVSVTRWNVNGTDVLNSGMAEGALSSCGLLCVGCHEKGTKMLAQWGRMHLKYEMFPAGGYGMEGGFPLIQFKKDKEKGHSPPLISKQV